MRILLTGAAGFIGSHVGERLLTEGHTVIGIDNFDPFYDKGIKENNLRVCNSNNNFSFFELDIVTDKKSLSNLPMFDMVIHLAAKAGVRPSIENPEAYIDANFKGTNNILELLKNRELNKLVFASSSSVYGNCKNIPFQENEPLDKPISPYAFSKRSCEMMNYTYHHLYNIDIVNLRFFTVFGPRQRPDLAIHKFITKIFNGEAIHMFGNGTSARDYTYIDDIVKGVIDSMHYVSKTDNTFEVMNLGNNIPVQLDELIKIVEKVVGKKALVKQLPMQAGDVEITCASIEKAKELISYQPKVTVEKGIQNSFDWLKSSFKNT